MKRLKFRPLSQTQVIALGFFLLILVGALVLSLPVSSRSGEATPFRDALFTSTSATCVTGLVVLDTGTHFSLFGQIVILILIEIGGLGFITIVAVVLMGLGKRIGLRQRQLISESINASNASSIRKNIRTIFFGSMIIQGAGAGLLCIRFIPKFGALKGIWFGIFHSVSAFCNAGFDLMGSVDGEYSSFTAYSSDILVNLTLMALIIIGGIGFLVWEDIKENGLRFKRYRLQTKIVLSVSFILIFAGAGLFLLFEWNGLFNGMDTKEKILSAAFSSVTPRTAGFNTVDTGALSTPSNLLTVILMFIGGSPGSTAGGVKTTSVAVILIYAFCSMRRTQSANVFGRKIDTEILKKSVFIVALNLVLALAGTVAISAIQPLGMSDALFESFSAMGTVGMTTGITRDLLLGSRLIICALMYLGRVGSVSFALALMEKRGRPPVSYPSENINVG